MSQTEGHDTKYPTRRFKNVVLVKEKTEELFQITRDKEDMITKHMHSVILDISETTGKAKIRSLD